jgi:murein hydrolase activator
LKNIRYIAFLLCCLCCWLAPAQLAAQNRKELEEKRKKILKDIEATQRMLKKTEANKEAVYDRFVALQNQIESRETLIQTLQDEITAADESVQRNEAVITALSQDIKQMEAEYGRTVRNAFRRKTLSNPLLYILSAASLNQAFRRWLFLRKYDEFRKKQAAAIRATREMLSRKNQNIQDTRIEKENLLVSMGGQKQVLTSELTDKNKLIQSLGQDQDRLKKDLERKQVTYQSLNVAIERVIEEEISKREAEAKKKKPKTEAEKPKPTPVPPKVEKPAEKPATKVTPKPTPPKPTPAEERSPEVLPEAPQGEEDVETQDFRASQGRLPWPVANGFIARKFGKQKHPTLPNLEITNNGIDIRTEESAAVSSVFAGRVAGVQYIAGHDYTVIIQHGDYYTVYSNLAQTTLQKGDPVRIRQNIGTVSNNPITGASEIHFELWRQKERLNPALWIKK